MVSQVRVGGIKLQLKYPSAAFRRIFLKETHTSKDICMKAQGNVWKSDIDSRHFLKQKAKKKEKKTFEKQPVQESREALLLTWCSVDGCLKSWTAYFSETHNNLLPHAVSSQWAWKDLSSGILVFCKETGILSSQQPFRKLRRFANCRHFFKWTVRWPIWRKNFGELIEVL